MSFALQKHSKRRRREEHEEVDSEGSWAISYGDLVTLLLTFFILFFSMEEPSTQPNTLRLNLVDKVNSVADGKGNEKVYSSPNNPIQLEDKNKTAKQNGKSPILDKIPIPEEFNPIAYEVGEKVLIEFPSISFFDSSKVELTSEGTQSLEKFAKLFIPYAGNFFVSIRAFADTRKVRANIHRYKDNLELSALRSISAMRILSASGIPIDRIRTGGFGELVVTADELERIPANVRPKQDSLALARKIVLVIEPGEKQ
jgi:chemotaxis protein MotB